jgi:hypothetical protein
VEFPVKKIFLSIMICLSGLIGIPEAKTEPVTMVILAPLALEGAKQASPYVISSMQSGGQQLLEIGKDIGNIFRLPLGILQATLGIPFGLAGEGMQNIAAGVWAPFQLVGDIFILPLAFIPAGGS